MAKLARFANRYDDLEYVVIITDGEPQDHKKPGYEIKEVVEIGPDRNFSMFPCDVPLVDDDR